MCIEHLEERLQLSQELIDLAQQERDRELEALGRHWRIHDLLEAAEMEEARRQRDALAMLAEALRQPLYQHFAVGWEVVWAHMAGSVNEVEPLAERFKELGHAAQARDTDTLYRAQIIALERRRERLPKFIKTVEAAIQEHEQLLAWRAVLPLTRLIGGDPKAAIAEFEWFAQDGFSRIRRDMFWFTAICVLAETCALIAQVRRSQHVIECARELYDLIEPFKDRNVVVMQAACWGSSRRFLGLLAATLGDVPEAVSHLETAITRNEQCGNPAGAWIVRRDLAKLLLKRRADGDIDRAADLLREPLRAAKAMQAEDLITRIEGEVQAVERERQAITP
jgi:hypothetical protein